MRRRPVNLVVAIILLATCMACLWLGITHVDSAPESPAQWWAAVGVISAIPLFAAGISFMAWVKRW